MTVLAQVLYRLDGWVLHRGGWVLDRVPDRLRSFWPLRRWYWQPGELEAIAVEAKVQEAVLEWYRTHPYPEAPAHFDSSGAPDA